MFISKEYIGVCFSVTSLDFDKELCPRDDAFEFRDILVVFQVVVVE